MRKMLIMPDTVMLARELQASYERAISPAVQQAPHNSRQKDTFCRYLFAGLPLGLRNGTKMIARNNRSFLRRFIA